MGRGVQPHAADGTHDCACAEFVPEAVQEVLLRAAAKVLTHAPSASPAASSAAAEASLSRSEVLQGGAALEARTLMQGVEPLDCGPAADVQLLALVHAVYEQQGGCTPERAGISQANWWVGKWGRHALAQRATTAADGAGVPHTAASAQSFVSACAERAAAGSGSGPGPGPTSVSLSQQELLRHASLRWCCTRELADSECETPAAVVEQGVYRFPYVRCPIRTMLLLLDARIANHPSLALSIATCVLRWPAAGSMRGTPAGAATPGSARIGVSWAPLTLSGSPHMAPMRRTWSRSCRFTARHCSPFRTPCLWLSGDFALPTSRW